MSNQPNPYAAPQTSDRVAPEIAWAESNPAALRKVRLGLTLIYGGICCLLVLLISSPMFVAIGVFSQLGGLLSTALAGVVLIAGILLLLLMFLGGELLCLSVPEEAQGRPLVLASVIFQGLSVVLAILAFFMPLEEAALLAWCMITGLIADISLFCFLVFMYFVARFITKPELAGRAMRALAVGVAAIVTFYASLGAAYFQDQEFLVMNGLTLAGLFTGGIAMLVGFVMYANAVTYLRKAISV